MEVNSTAAIFIPSTPTFCQLELLAASDDGAIIRDVGGLSGRWIHASSVLIKTCPVLRPQLTRLTSLAPPWGGGGVTPERCERRARAERSAPVEVKCASVKQKGIRRRKRLELWGRAMGGRGGEKKVVDDWMSRWWEESEGSDYSSLWCQ